MKTTRGLLFGSVLVAAAAALGACGGQPFPTALSASTTTTPPHVALPANASPRARLLAAVQNATDGRTAHLALDMKVTGLGDGDDVTATGSGGIDFARGDMSLSMNVDTPDGAQQVDLRLVAGTAYVNSGDGWTSEAVGQADPASTPDLRNYLKYLQGVSSNVTVVGHDVLRGAETTHYRGSVDLASATPAIKDAKARASLQQALTMFGDIKIPMDVWLDAAGRPRKISMSIDMTAIVAKFGAPASLKPQVEISFELFDYGAPVTVVAPTGAKSAATVAQDQKTQSDLRNALTAAKVVFTDNATYQGSRSEVSTVEPSVDWSAVKYVVSPSGQAVCISMASASGTTFALYDEASATGETAYGKAACPATIGDLPPAGFSTTGW